MNIVFGNGTDPPNSFDSSRVSRPLEATQAWRKKDVQRDLPSPAVKLQKAFIWFSINSPEILPNPRFSIGFPKINISAFRFSFRFNRQKPWEPCPSYGLRGLALRLGIHQNLDFFCAFLASLRFEVTGPFLFCHKHLGPKIVDQC